MRRGMAHELDARGESTRSRILEVLRRRGPATLQQLATEVGITRMGVHQHLKGLVESALVQVERIRNGVGRPRHRYALTDAADDLFPRRYDELTRGLIRDLRSVGGEALLERVFQARCDRLEREYRARVDGKGLPERVRAVAEILEENGYMADWQQVDEKTYVIREHNCAICDIAKANDAPCKYELMLLKRLLGADVRRDRHMASGDPMCAYTIHTTFSV